MDKEKYLIGDVANLMGMSRDTLRYYEKRGLLLSEKGENGYRYYTKQDISRLVGILYQRKMNISLEDMETLWSADHTVPSLTDITASRLEEEEKAIRVHKQTIARLHLTHSDCNRIREDLNQVSIRNFPSAYVIVPRTTILESNELWFQMAKKHLGLDMMYMLDNYTVQSDASFQLNYQNTQLILYKELEEMVDYPVASTTSETTPVRCVYSLRASIERTPCADTILSMLSWAKEQDIALSNHLYSTYTMQGLQNGQHIFYIEIYIPLL